MTVADFIKKYSLSPIFQKWDAGEAAAPCPGHGTFSLQDGPRVSSRLGGLTLELNIYAESAEGCLCANRIKGVGAKQVIEFDNGHRPPPEIEL
jgi:hypothetical protein